MIEFMFGLSVGILACLLFLHFVVKPIEKRAIQTDFLFAGEEDTVNLQFDMSVKKRWVPHVLGFFNRLEELGSIGSSRMIGFYADGDGDFRPKFSVFGDPILKEGEVSCWGGRVSTGTVRLDATEKFELKEWFDAG